MGRARLKTFDAADEVLDALRQRPAPSWLPARAYDRTDQLRIGSLGKEAVYACAAQPTSEGKFGHLHLHLASAPAKKLSKNELAGGAGCGFFDGVQFRAEHQRYIRDGFIFLYCQRVNNIELIRRLWNEDNLFRINLTWLARQKTRESLDTASRASRTSLSRTHLSTPGSFKSSQSSALSSSENDIDSSHTTDALPIDQEDDAAEADTPMKEDDDANDHNDTSKAAFNRRIHQLKDQMKTKDQQVKTLRDQMWNLHQKNGELRAENDLMRGYIKTFLASETDSDMEAIVDKFRAFVGEN